MLKFFLGTAVGTILSFVFVRFGIEPPAVTKLPEKLKANLVATAVEADLYDLDATGGVHERALKIYFANRAGDAAKLDASAGHPFLKTLHRARAVREARVLTALWAAYDKVLSQPALRAALERKHGVREDEPLKQAMLMDALAERPFLESWLEREHGSVTNANVRVLLADTATPPAP